MYINPVLFPQFSNREDFLATISLYDDDTFQLLNLHQCQTASGSPFTASAWTVVDGAITTTSATAITIPAFPIGAQLSALNLTVDAGLAILPGDAVTISDTATGLNTMTGFVTSYTSSSGSLTCQIGWTYQFEIRKMPPNWQPGLGYISWYDFGVAEQAPILQYVRAVDAHRGRYGYAANSHSGKHISHIAFRHLCRQHDRYERTRYETAFHRETPDNMGRS